MLVASGMGGMDEMSIFCENQTSPTYLRSDVTLTIPPDALAADDHCLESLYPPGMCVSEHNARIPWDIGFP